MRQAFALVVPILVLLSGCLASQEADLAPATPGRMTEGIPADPDYVTPFARGTCTITLTSLAYNGTGHTSSTACDAEQAAGADVSAAKAVLLELDWDELQATVLNVHIVSRGPDAAHEAGWNTFQGAYPAPLRMVLHERTLEELGDGLSVDLAISGAALDQEFTLHASFFAEDLVDPAYSDIA